MEPGKGMDLSAMQTGAIPSGIRSSEILKGRPVTRVILPCPFCGWLSPLIQFGEHDIRVWCPNCHATGPHFDDSEYDEEQAVECWNLRREPSVTHEQDASKRISDDCTSGLEAINAAMGKTTSDMEHDLQVKRDLQAGVVRDSQGNVIPPPPQIVTEEELGPPRRVNDLDTLIFLEKWCKPNSSFAEVMADFEVLISQASRFAWHNGKKVMAQRCLGAIQSTGNCKADTDLMNLKAKMENVQYVLNEALKP